MYVCNIHFIQKIYIFVYGLSCFQDSQYLGCLLQYQGSVLCFFGNKVLLKDYGFKCMTCGLNTKKRRAIEVIY